MKIASGRDKIMAVSGWLIGKPGSTNTLVVHAIK